MKTHLRFVHFSDTHISTDPDWESHGHYALDNAQAVVNFLSNKLPFVPDLFLHTGDVVFDPYPEAYPTARDVLKPLPAPVYYVRGNHDDPSGMRQYLETVPSGAGKLDYDFVVNGFHFMVLDTFGFTPTLGILEDEQLGWLQQTLKHSTADSIIIAIHHLPTVTGIPSLDERMILTNHDAFFDTLRPYRERIRGIFFGHVHRQTMFYRDGILCSSVPSTWFQLQYFPETGYEFMPDPDARPGFNIVTVTPDQVWITHHTLPQASR